MTQKHSRKAVHERLAKEKLSTTPYDAKHARTEFPFICLDFIPVVSADATEYEGGNLDESGDAQPPPQDPNTVHIQIPVPPSLRAPPLTAPPPMVPTHLKPQPIFGEHANTNSEMPTLLLSSPSARGNSGLTIRLPASAGKENCKPGAATSATADVATDKTAKRTFCPVDYRGAIVDMIDAE
jgi:hypothetical protein